MLRVALKFAVGLIAGVLLWWYLTPLYARAVAYLAAPILRLDGRVFDVEWVAIDRAIQLRSASGAFPSATLFVDQFTYNIVLFVALVFATQKRLIQDRTMRALVAGILLLFASHVLSFVCVAFSIYATGQGTWSDAYGPIESRIWSVSAYFLGVVGTLAMAFVAWIVVRALSDESRRRK